MTTIMNWLSQDFAGQLAGTLLHSLWLGAILSALLFIILWITPARMANLRYLFSVLALAALLIGGFVTLAILGHEPVAPASDTGSEVATHEASPSGDEAPTIMETTALPGDSVDVNNEDASEDAHTAILIKWTGWATGVWVLGVVVMLVRMAAMVLGANRLRRGCRTLDDGVIRAAMDRLEGLLKVTRKVGLACCEHIHGPMVIGVLRPTILLPASLISGVPVEQIEAVLAHELAHIRRYDYLVNLGQMLVEALLFFNPAVWWIGRQIRVEREACCDALAETVAAQETGYAQALAGVIERLAPAAQPAAAMAFAGPKDGGCVVDRIRRLAVPFHRPIPRLPVYGFLAALFAGAVLVGALWRGTTAAVDEAAKFLTCEERIEELARIEEEYAWNNEDPNKLEKVTVSGIVRTHDGSPLPEDLRYVNIHSRAPGIISGYSPTVTDGRFSYEVHPGQISLSVETRQYAPALLGPFPVNPGESLDDIEIVLQPGFTGRIRVVATNGEPVAGARVRGGLLVNGVGAGGIDLSTDETGMASVEHWIDHPMNLNVLADGYERDWRDKISLSAAEVYEWKLKPAKTATGIVVSSETGKPVSGARLRLVERFGYQPNVFDRDAEDRLAEFMAQTEGDGMFRLTSLRSDCRYVFLVEAPGLERTFLRNVGAGDTGLKVELGPEIYVRGRIVGLDEEDLKGGSKLRISFSQVYISLDDVHHSYAKNVPVEVKDGEGHFFIPDRWRGSISIYAFGQRRSMILGKAVEDLVIDLTPPPADETPMREVVIRFNVPEQGPLPTGEIEVAHAVPGAAAYSGYTKLPITNGEVRCKVPAPCNLLYRSEGLEGSKGIIGYWLKEQSGIKIPTGADPFIVVADLVPAGAIYGTVVNADGTHAIDARVTIIVVGKSPSMNYPFLDNSIRRLGMEGKFESGSLPLGGTYVIAASDRRSSCHALSREIKLDASQPVAEVKMTFSEGVRVNGRILTPDGQPAVGVPCGLHYATPYSHGLGCLMKPSDSDGSFVMEHVNPDLRGTYTLRVWPDRDFQPVSMKIVPSSKPLTIRLKRGNILTGKVIDDKTGRPVSGARVHAWLKNSENLPLHIVYSELPSDTKGEFRFSNLPEGRCSIYVDGRWIVGTQPEVDVKEGANPSVTLRVKE